MFALAVTLSTTPIGPAPAVATLRPPGSAAVPSAGYPAHCRDGGDPIPAADGLLQDRYQLGTHPAVTLPHDLTWTEDPFHDTNWMFLLHSLQYVKDLLDAWRLTGEQRYLDRALELGRDWAADNSVGAEPSIWAWNDHSAALRGVVFACFKDLGVTIPPVIEKGVRRDWLGDVLRMHGRMLADPVFYRHAGNHALNQAIALLEIGRVLRDDSWLALATQRLDTLGVASIDTQGVTNEQAVGYQQYNWSRYGVARDRLLAIGRTPGPWTARLDLMPRFLVHATLPDGFYEMIGDTEHGRALSIPGTANEFAATAGASGPRPASSVVTYSAGFQFARTGWGEDRANTDETFLSIRWGPAPRFHGHADGGSITLYGFGTRLIVDPGKLDYNPGKWRAFFKGRSAHNVVTADGLAWTFLTSTSVVDQTVDDRLVHRRLRSAGFPGVVNTRRVSFSRSMGYVVVEDRVTSSSIRTFRQLWHLVEDANPQVTTAGVITRRARGNLLIRQLIGRPGVTVVKGRSDPVQGWISYRHGTKVAAPVIEVTQRGTSVRYLTLLVPSEGVPAATVSGQTVTSDGYSLVVTIGGRSERLVVNGKSATITPLG